jgi:hypothetical protein
LFGETSRHELEQNELAAAGSSYHRIMAGLSLADIFFSLSVFWQSFSMPAKKVSWPWAFGNVRTCSFVGFTFSYFAIAVAALYNGFLSVMFLSMVAFNLKSNEIRKRLEWLGHAIVWILPLCSQVPAVITGSTSFEGLPGVMSTREIVYAEKWQMSLLSFTLVSCYLERL